MPKPKQRTFLVLSCKMPSFTWLSKHTLIWRYHYQDLIFDFFNALNTISPAVLHQRLHETQVDASTIYYLTNRAQFVRISGLCVSVGGQQHGDGTITSSLQFVHLRPPGQLI